MNEKIANTIIFLHCAILILLIIFIPNTPMNSTDMYIHDFISEYMFKDIGIISLNRPFMSMVISNYIAITSPIIGIVMYTGNILDKNKPSNLSSNLITIALSSLALYISYLSSYELNIPKNLLIRAEPDSLWVYFICIFLSSILSALFFCLIIDYIVRKTRGTNKK